MENITDNPKHFEEIRNLLHRTDNPIDSAEVNADSSLLKELSDLFHNIKVIAGEAEEPWVYEISHKMAHYIDLLRTTGETFDRAKLVVLEDCRDLLTHYIDGVDINADSLEDWNSDLRESLSSLRNQKDTESELCRYHIEITYDDNSFYSDAEPLSFLEAIASQGKLIERKINKSMLPSFEELNPEQCYISWSCIIETTHNYKVFEDIFMENEHDGTYHIEKLKTVEKIDHGKVEKIVEPQITEEIVSQGISNFQSMASVASNQINGLVVDPKRLDSLMNLLGEIVIGHSSISRFAEGLEVDASSELQNAMYGLDRTTREFQEQLMAIRTVQMGQYLEQLKTFCVMKAEERGTTIGVEISGHETELDRTMIERISKPIRNILEYTINYSIENSEERKEKDKDITPRIQLKAYHQEGSVLIEISDDGMGFDFHVLKKQAEEVGLIKKGEDVSKGRILSYLLNNDFTKIFYNEMGSAGSDLKEIVENLRGTIDIDSIPNKGTTYKIKLPLSLAIIEGMAVRVGENVYIIPLLSIVESIQPKRDDVKTVEGKGEVIQARGEYIALVRLYQYYNITSEISNPWESLVVIVESNGVKVGIMVDDLIGQQQVVIKNLGSDLADNKSISGASILGDGKISLIIDIHGLVEEITT